MGSLPCAFAVSGDFVAHVFVALTSLIVESLTGLSPPPKLINLLHRLRSLVAAYHFRSDHVDMTRNSPCCCLRILLALLGILPVFV